MFLVLIETSGNQNFIFATNKLKENVGASELTYRVGTQWLLEIVADLNNIPELRDSQSLRQNLLKNDTNPCIENSDKEIEIIVAASGKALLITKTEAIAKEIITRITTKALKEAPGIDVSGVWVEFDWKNPINEYIKEVYREFEKVHSRLYSPSFRFLRLPICAPCETSGLPASSVETNPEKKKIPVSAVSLAKAKNANDSLNRMQKLVNNLDFKFPENTNNLEKDFDNLQWLAIVHADGNGLGQIFMNFEKYATDNRDYINKMRRFSLALDLCTEEAFKQAITVFETKEKSRYKILPVVPLVLGGDDLTVVCDGKYALEFTREFLQAFEKETQKPNLPDVGNIITEIAQKGLNSKGLSACAGIAIIKPHFPFSVGYKLAESLLKSAKKVKNKVKDNDNQDQTISCSALDFQIVYDSSGIDLELIRDRLSLEEADNKTLLYKRPFVITPLENLTQASRESQTWANFYHWDKFKTKVDNISQKKTSESEQGSFLPPNQSNRIRSALLRGKQAADAEFKLIEHRYAKTKDLKETPQSLFILIPDHEPDQPTYTTSFLDALEAVDFV